MHSLFGSKCSNSEKQKNDFDEALIVCFCSKQKHLFSGRFRSPEITFSLIRLVRSQIEFLAQKTFGTFALINLIRSKTFKSVIVFTPVIKRQKSSFIHRAHKKQ